MRIATALVLAVSLTAASCSVADLGGAPAHPSSPAPPSVGPAKLLTRLRVEPRTQPVDYDRDAFGSAWADTDGNGCNQRDDVLLRDAVPGSTTVAQQDGCDHDVLAGTWVDPYTGRTLTFDDLKDLSQAQAIQIDHVVPLAEAWASGADAWTGDERRTYANDLSELLAVDGPTNASKGDDDPAAWRPRKDFQCEYAKRWIRTKYRYDLAVDPSEVKALQEMLGYC
ncbi:HNH endonuclease family protein [Nocardioides sp. MH1]|uniref:HNH endonuclease family protein n=1 Tax=Nocardioides sp. MH1 TaxID=3242490 RepID=UPI003521D2C5